MSFIYFELTVLDLDKDLRYFEEKNVDIWDDIFRILSNMFNIC